VDNNYLHTVGAIGTTAWEALDLTTGTNTVLNGGMGAGVASNICVNDVLHSTQMFPREESELSSFVLEAAAHGEAGDPAAILLVTAGGLPVSPPQILGVGACDQGGFYVLNTPVAAGQFPAGTTAGLMAVVCDLGTGKYRFGGITTITILP